MPMKIGCAAWGFREQNFQQYFFNASKLGLKRLEVSCIPEVRMHLSTFGTPLYLDTVRKAQNYAHVQLVALAAKTDFSQTDPVRLQKEFDILDRVLENAKALQVGIVRVFAGFAEPCDETLERHIAHSLRRAGQLAAPRNVTLVVQNYHGIASAPDRLERLMRQAEHPAVRLCFDPACYLQNNIDPLAALRQTKPWVAYVHLKDFKKGKGFCPLGKGDLNYQALLDALKDFNGYGMIAAEEPATASEDTADSLVYLEKQGLFAEGATPPAEDAPKI